MRDKAGCRDSDFGWEADHIKPLAQDGTYDLDNMLPLNWYNNATKSDEGTRLDRMPTDTQYPCLYTDCDESDYCQNN